MSGQEALQRRCVEMGAYWRAPDAHGVSLSVGQAEELLREALGVEVEIRSNEPSRPYDGGSPTQIRGAVGPLADAGIVTRSLDDWSA